MVSFVAQVHALHAIVDGALEFHALRLLWLGYKVACWWCFGDGLEYVGAALDLQVLELEGGHEAGEREKVDLTHFN